VACVFSHIVLDCKGSWKKANPSRGGDAKLTDLFPKEVAGLPKGGAPMGKTPTVVSGQPSAHASLPHDAWARYFVVGHRHANPLKPYGILCTRKELELLWREVLALLDRRHRYGR
jgi:hypothetical protein